MAHRITLLATIRHQRRSATVLSMMVLAWVGILVTPCATTFAAAALSPELVAAHHGDCPNAHAQTPTSESDCCCDLSVPLTVEKPELPKPSVQPGLAAELDWRSRVLSSEGASRRQSIQRYGTSPPVYLATQRLRI